jgi:diguanylate cyclase (GGDEF)-like protein
MSRVQRSGRPSLRSMRAWELWSAPCAMRRFVLCVELAAVLSSLYFVLSTDLTRSGLVRFGLLLGLSMLFEEVSARSERLRLRLQVTGHVDMTSVWTFAGAVVLDPGLAVILVVLIRMLVWHRYHRSPTMKAYRQVYTASAIIVACLVASEVLRVVRPMLASLPAGAVALLVVALAIVVYTVVNTALIFSAIYLVVRPKKILSLIENWHDVALEFATLCLGGMTAVTVLFQPWLAILVIPPMAVLQRSALVKELEVAATTDSKTGLLNAVTWQQLAQRELARAQREQSTAALLIIDMDNFKLINDTYGHLVGDAVLKALGSALTEELRGYDTVGRFGGEEFVAMLSDADATTALAVADRILERVRTLAVAASKDDETTVSNLSASIGIACYPDQGTEVEDLLHAADAALYRAKRAGRDRVEFHTNVL